MSASVSVSVSISSSSSIIFLASGEHRPARAHESVRKWDGIGGGLWGERGGGGGTEMARQNLDLSLELIQYDVVCEAGALVPRDTVGPRPSVLVLYRCSTVQ